MVQPLGPLPPSTPSPKVQLTLESLPPDVLAEMRGRLSLSDEQIGDLVQSINDGATTVGEFIGMTPAAANTFEGLALNYYRNQQYGIATNLYSFILELFPERASGWRGLGACHQATKEYALAITCYVTGLQYAPKDLAMLVFLGECYCLIDRPRVGGQVLQEALAVAPTRPAHKIYLKRAQAILQAQAHKLGQDVSIFAAANELATESDPAAAMADGASEDPGQQALDRDRERAGHGSAATDALLQQPEVVAMMEKILEAVKRDRITVKEMAGFTDEQMHGAYAAACRYLELSQPATAMEIIGWLLFFDARNAEYYQLAGICAQHLGLHCFADYMHGLSLIYGPNNPATMIYRGEAMIFSEERHAGVALIREALDLCAHNSQLHEVAQRGKKLLQQFDNRERNRGNA